MQSWDDASLIRAIADGREEALLVLYDRYSRLAFGLAYRILGDAPVAEEVVQDTFLSIWTNASRFIAQRGSVRSWLLTIVRNRALDELRRRRARPLPFSLETAMSGDTVHLDEALIARIDAAQVRAALSSLPEEQRLVIELAYFDGLTHHEIAERLRIPLGTVKSRLRLGLHKLADLLGIAQPERMTQHGDDR